jgi:hypothetical protein
MTPCYYCEEDADVACRACIHSSTGPEIEQVIAWRAAPPPAADAVTDAMVDRALDAWWGCTPPSAGYAPDERDDMRLAIAAALAARSEK